MIYLASPYTHDSLAIIANRFDLACQASYFLIRMGHRVFSPVAHSHAIVVHGNPFRGPEISYEKWMDLDLAILEKCSSLMILTLPGWQDSKGIKMEADHALQLGIPLMYLDLDPESDTPQGRGFKIR